MRTVLVLLLGVVLGCAVTLGGVLLAGDWYEYHLVDAAAHDNPIVMVNREGWELLPLGQLRRPKLRLH